MSSILSAVFKVTFGLILKKGRDVVAEKLKQGDVTDQKFRGLIVREMEDLKTKLDGLSRKDLGAALDFFETGLRYLNDAVDATRSGKNTEAGVEETKGNKHIKEDHFDELTLPLSREPQKAVLLAAGMGKMQLTELDETVKSALSDAKERFRMAREKATDASNNESLSTFDRITAIRYRVMAAMLESASEAVRTAEDLNSTFKRALPECEQCIQKLHSLPAVQNSFKVETDRGVLKIRSRFGSGERRKIISAVCQVNRAIYDVTHAVGKYVHFWIWPYIDTGEDKVDPLRDERVVQAMCKIDMKYCCFTPWSFVPKGTSKYMLNEPVRIAGNIDGKFLILDNVKSKFYLKSFDSKGKFYSCFELQPNDLDSKLEICDVAIVDAGNDSKIYVLFDQKKEPRPTFGEVQVFTSSGDPLHKFPVDMGRRKLWRNGLACSRGKAVVLNKQCANVYDRNGEFVCTFGKGVFKYAADITASYDSRLMILDKHDACIHIFTVEGQQLSKFNINLNCDSVLSHSECCIACHLADEHIAVAECEQETKRLRVTLYTANGEFVRKIELDKQVYSVKQIAVSSNGQIAVHVLSRFCDRANEVIVF